MWVIVGILVALLAVGIAAGVVLTIRRRSPEQPVGAELTPEQWTALGVVFFGAGVAMWLTLGPAMIGMSAMGLIFMGMGIKEQRASAGKNRDSAD